MLNNMDFDAIANAMGFDVNGIEGHDYQITFTVDPNDEAKAKLNDYLSLTGQIAG